MSLPALPPIARSFAAVMSGMIVAVTVVSVCDLGAASLHPTPEGFDIRNMEQARAHAASAPVPAMLLVLTGWILGPFAGGVVASRVAERNRRMFAWVIAGLFFSATVSNLIAIPHPTWMIAGGVFGVPAAGWLAARLAPKG